MVTFSVLKFDTSIEVNLQPMNMEDMSVTLAVSKFVTSSEVRAEQYWNIRCMLVTLAVLKLFTLSEVRVFNMPNI